MNPEQFQELLKVVQESGGSGGLSWLMAALAFGSILVSVTGVVVGMRFAIAALATQMKEQGVRFDSQIKDQGARLEGLTDKVNSLAQHLAILEYATGVNTEIPPSNHLTHKTP